MRVRPRLGGAPVVVSLTGDAFLLRAFGFWKGYLVEGTIDEQETGCRIVLSVSRAGRLKSLQGALAVTLVVAALPMVGIGIPYGALFGRWEVVLWSGAAVALAGVTAALVSFLGDPPVKDRELAPLKRSLSALLDATVVG